MQQQGQGRRVLLDLRRVAGLQGCVQDLEAADVHHGEAVLQAPWSAAKLPYRVVDVVSLGHVRHEGGGRAEPIPAGEEELSAGRQVVGAHDVPGSGCSRPHSLRPRCAWPGPRCVRCWDKPTSLTGRRGRRLVGRKAHGYL